MALESFWKQAMAMGGGFVVEVDVKSFFDAIDHGDRRLERYPLPNSVVVHSVYRT